jgi:hypothetical protein
MKQSLKRFSRALLLSLTCAALLGGTLLQCAAQTPYLDGPDSQIQPGVPQGQTFQFDVTGKKYYPGTKSTIFVYVPAQYTPDKPAFPHDAATYVTATSARTSDVADQSVPK